MPQTNITHIVTDALGKVVAVTNTVSEAETYAESGRTANAKVLTVASLDVAACARLAEVNCPKLTAKGTGPLGAGTHPAQPYLEYMRSMRGITASNIRTTMFGYDAATGIVLRFCDNATIWRGAAARAIKAHLRAMAARP